MKFIKKFKQTLPPMNEYGGAALVSAIMVTGALTAGSYMLTDHLGNVEQGRHLIETSQMLADVNRELIEITAQMISTEGLVDVTEEEFKSDTSASRAVAEGGYGWNLNESGASDLFSFDRCYFGKENDLKTKDDIEDVFDDEKEAQRTCSDDEKIKSSIFLQSLVAPDSKGFSYAIVVVKSQPPKGFRVT